MTKRIHHMGMVVSQENHKKFHERAPDLSPKQHAALIKRLGVTKEQDEQWHRTHLTLGEQRAAGLRHVDPAAIGVSFIAWCVRQGWIVQRGNESYASNEGARAIRDQFEITL